MAEARVPASTSPLLVPQRRDKRVVLALLAALALVVTAAGGYYYSTRIDAVTILRIGAGPRGTDLFELVEGIARVAETKAPLIKVEAVETAGADENLVLLESGRLELAAVPSDALTRPGLSMIASLFPDAYHLIVATTAGISKVEDLPGKRIAIPPVGTSENRSFWYLVSQYTIPPESFSTRPMKADDAIKALRADRVDGVFLLRAPGDRRIRWLADAKSVRIVPIDQFSALIMRRPSLVTETLFRGSYAGTPAVPYFDVPTVAAQRLLLARSGLALEPVRSLTSVLFDNKRELNVQSRLAAYVRQPDLEAGTLLPVHPGALAYYDRNQPSFLQKNSDLIGITISLAAVLFSVLLWLKNRLFATRKNTADVYNLDLIALAEEARAAKSKKTLAACRTRLDAMLARMVRDLDEDKIDGEGFNYFAFTWEAARKTIEDRERALTRSAPAIPPAT
jgi:uncharacterized protein